MRPLFIVLLAAGCGIVPGTGLGTGTGPRGESFSTSGGICVDDSEPADDVEFDVVYSGAEGNGMPTGPAVQRLTAQEEQPFEEQEASGDVDLSEMIGDYSEAEGEEAGMHVSTAAEAEAEPGFEDVDLSQVTGED